MGILLTFGAVSGEASHATSILKAVCTRGARGSYRYVPPQRVRFLGHFGLESGMVFEGTTGVCERKKNCVVCIVFIPNERTK